MRDHQPESVRLQPETSMNPVSAALVAALCLGPAVAAAQSVRDCDTWEANARNLMMPPEVAIRSFAQGEVRVIGLDTLEPACCSAHLMVDFLVDDEPFPLCALVSASDSMGFSGLDMAGLAARYDPAAGLILTLPAGRYDGAASVMSPLTVVLNRATATVTAKHE
jgi:hypothetical protein